MHTFSQVTSQSLGSWAVSISCSLFSRLVKLRNLLKSSIITCLRVDLLSQSLLRSSSAILEQLIPCSRSERLFNFPRNAYLRLINRIPFGGGNHQGRPLYVAGGPTRESLVKSLVRVQASVLIVASTRAAGTLRFTNHGLLAKSTPRQVKCARIKLL